MLGGIAEKTNDVLFLCSAAGYDTCMRVMMCLSTYSYSPPCSYRQFMTACSYSTPSPRRYRLVSGPGAVRGGHRPGGGPAAAGHSSGSGWRSSGQWCLLMISRIFLLGIIISALRYSKTIHCRRRRKASWRPRIWCSWTKRTELCFL